MKRFAILLGAISFFAAAAAMAAVNVNTATAEELQSLDGIGEVKAQAIVAYREENGDFNNLAELKEVDGIGSATAKDLADDVTFESE